MSKAPVANKVSESTVQTVWEVRYPSTSVRPGAAYRARTYPKTDLVTVETWITQRRVSPLVARNIMPEIKAAIAAAQAA